jgi:hypothetical protein
VQGGEREVEEARKHEFSFDEQYIHVARFLFCLYKVFCVFFEQLRREEDVYLIAEVSLVVSY